MDIHTETSLTYHFLPLVAGSLKFRVKAVSDAHICLASGPSEDFPTYHIIIGGWKNTKSVIRRNEQTPDVASASTPSILDEKNSKEFWIKWSAGNIMVGLAGNSHPFLLHWDPESFPLSYYGVCTGWGATGEWLVEGGRSIVTENKMKFQFFPVPSGLLTFDVQCPSNAQIALVSARNPKEYEKFPRLEVIVGGWENTKSAIRRDGSDRCVVTAETPGIVSKDGPKTFALHWKNGAVYLDGGSKGSDTILEYHSPEHIAVTHIGVRTSYGSSGDWKLIEGEESDIGGNDVGVAGMEWRAAVGGKMPEGGLIGGHESSDVLYVGRTSFGLALIPGKVVPLEKKCYVTRSGKVESSTQFQVLCGSNCKWAPVTPDCSLPAAGIHGGYTEDGQPLYIGRANHEGAAIIGKVQFLPDQIVCTVAHSGQELTFKEFELLVRK
ncbi:uncharacterized protein LOC124160609 isoform X2 [Ischnura elegans]|uniref:uncharacterized protein LOC124160609 isoform X2 n=1 Tax=Ischnura elegans TaxID=197161 RepID=UPI001ED87B48|nr:uncharacterized protein LOC124160609 isoform X2 [Ischnura elegans]